MTALILVDIQNDFLPGGALAVGDGNTILPVVNALIPGYTLVVATQDWHPPGHHSFASNHPTKQVGDIIELKGLKQVLWPDHCVQQTEGADFSNQLNTDVIAKVFRKGTDPQIDSYSGFYDNGHLKATGMGDYLKLEGVNQVHVVGLATDYCVKYTALDAIALGFSTTVIIDAVRAVNLNPTDEQKAMEEMENAGVSLINSADFT